VAAARVIRAGGGHCSDVFVLWDLGEQFGQDRTVATLLEVNSTALMSEVAV
jgi:hypothetical protein